MNNLEKRTIPEENMGDLLKKHFERMENEILFQEDTRMKKTILMARVARYGLVAVTWIKIAVWLLYEILY